MYKGVVYRLVNRETGQSYVGRTFNFKKRLWEHNYLAKRASGITLERPIIKAIREFGMNAFEPEVLYEAEGPNRDEVDRILDEKEKYFIEKYDSISNGYNLTVGGKGTIGYTQSQATKDKRNKANTGKKRSQEYKIFMSKLMKGKPGHKQSEEVRRRISNKLKGIPKTDSHRRNAAEAKKGLKRPCLWIPILQYSPEGIFIKEWPSIREAKNLYGSNQIGCCARGKFRTICGFIWRYKTSDDIPQKIDVPTKRNSKGLFMPE